MAKKYELDESEKNLFRSAMRGVKPLSHTKISIQPKPPKKVIRSTQEEENKNPFNFYEADHFTEVDSEDTIEFYRPGLQHKVLRKFRRGQYNVEAVLDMHGMRAHEAKEALNFFLLNCLRNGLRHILIIHGKGRGNAKPVLKNKLNQWLRQVDEVLAFCSATQQQGNTGALYVLLKGRSQFEE